MANTKNVKLGVCRVLFGGVDLGLTKGGVEVEVATETYKVEVDQFGKTPINEYIMGRTVTASVPLAETSLENMVSVMPGASIVQTGGTKASGTITIGATQPVANDTVVVNGTTFTFKVAAAAANEVTIGATAAATAANLAAVLSAYVGQAVSAASYTVASGVVTVTYNLYGTGGNAFTLAKTGSGVTLSGATLSGGVDSTLASVSVPTGIGTDLLSIAKKLVFHPIGKADTDTSDDFVIPFAATAGALSFAYKLDQERVYNVSFMAYPNPTTSELFYVGSKLA